MVDRDARQLRRQRLALGVRDRLLFRLRATQVDEFLLNGGDVRIDRVFQQQPLFTAKLFALFTEAVAAQHRNLMRELADVRVLELNVLRLLFELAHQFGCQRPQGVGIEVIKVRGCLQRHGAMMPESCAAHHSHSPGLQSPGYRTAIDSYSPRRCQGRPMTRARACSVVSSISMSPERGQWMLP